jgi:hypothetical protein
MVCTTRLLHSPTRFFSQDLLSLQRMDLGLFLRHLLVERIYSVY